MTLLCTTLNSSTEFMTARLACVNCQHSRCVSVVSHIARLRYAMPLGQVVLTCEQVLLVVQTATLSLSVVTCCLVAAATAAGGW